MDTTNSSFRKDSVFSLIYVKILKLLLRTIGAWPGKSLGETESLFEKYYRYVLPPQTIVMICGAIAYLIKNSDTITFLQLGHIYITIFLSVMMLVRSILPHVNKYSQLIQLYYNNFHLIHFKDLGDNNLKVYQSVDKVSFYFTILSTAVMFVAAIFFNLVVLYNDYKIGAFGNHRVENSTLEFSVYYYFPGFNQNELFLISTIFNVYLSLDCTMLICVHDFFIYVMVFQVIGHICVLIHNIEDTPGPKMQTVFKVNGVKLLVNEFDEEENKQCYKKLIQYLEHHKFITSFAGDISTCFGPIFACSYLFHMVSCCLLLLECYTLDLDALLQYAGLTFIIFGQLIQTSVLFEVISAKSERLAESVYYMPWECMDTRNRRVVLMLLRRVQTPIRLTAMGVVDVGVQTMAKILKTTFSYFTFLTSMNE